MLYYIIFAICVIYRPFSSTYQSTHQTIYASPVQDVSGPHMRPLRSGGFVPENPAPGPPGTLW